MKGRFQGFRFSKLTRWNASNSNVELAAGLSITGWIDRMSTLRVHEGQCGYEDREIETIHFTPLPIRKIVRSHTVVLQVDHGEGLMIAPRRRERKGPGSMLIQ